MNLFENIQRILREETKYKIMSKEIRQMIDKVKNFKEFLNENKNIFKDKLLYHLDGGTILDSVENIDIFINYFKGNIPQELKYEGVLYRVFQTKSKTLYEKVLKNGFDVLENQKYYACSKSLKGIKSVLLKTSKRRYKYYIVFKFNVNNDDVLFDINNVIDYIGLDENRFRDEEEVLVLSNKIPHIPKENIIKDGLL